jgi:hypothetical protein
MSGEFIYRPHTCDTPDEYKQPKGTIWECECGKQFERVRSRGRVPYPYWVWSNAPEKPKKKRWWQS